MIIVMNGSPRNSEEALGTMMDEALEDSRRMLVSLNHMAIPSEKVYLIKLFPGKFDEGVINIDEARRGHSIASGVVEASLGLTKRYTKLVKRVMDQRIGRDIQEQMVLEFECLFLHCIDRIAFNQLDEGTRLSLMDDLFRNIALRNNILLPTRTSQCFLRCYNDAALSYSTCEKLITDYNRERTRGTLIWEFSRKISTLIHGRPRAYLIYFGILSIPFSIRGLGIEEGLKRWGTAQYL